MRKVYENFEYTRVGHYQGILESEGIPTLVKNTGAAMATGEIPFTEIYPELWVVEDSDYDRAVAMLDSYRTPDTADLKDWTCPKCGEEIEKQFSECWKCGTERPGFEVVEEEGS